MGTEKDRKDTQQAVLYELRRLIKKSGKDYTNQELCDLIDTIAEFLKFSLRFGEIIPNSVERAGVFAPHALQAQDHNPDRRYAIRNALGGNFQFQKVFLNIHSSTP